MQRFSNSADCSFLWEIRDFPLYLELYKDKLESPPFFTKCSEVIGWFLVLKHRDQILGLSLHRLNRMDDLNDLQMEYQVSVVGEDGDLYMTESFTSYMVNQNRSMHILNFDSRQLDECMHDETLRLQFDMNILIQTDVTRRWNFSNELMELSRDILRLYKTGSGSDRRIRVDNKDFKVHSLIIAARCPELKLRFVPEDRIMSLPQGSQTGVVRLKRIQEFVQQLELPPKSSVPERSPKAASSPREERFLKVFTASVCDTFLTYLYSGRYDIMVRRNQNIDEDTRLRLLIVARRYKLMDLVRKLQIVEKQVTAVTEVVTDTVTLDLGLGFVHKSNVDTFKPITRLVNLSSTGKKYLEVTFSVFKRSCNNTFCTVYHRLIESKLPVTLKFEILVFKSNSEYSRVSSWMTFKKFSDPSEGLSVDIPIPFSQHLRLRCKFTVCSVESVRMSRQEFAISSTPFYHPHSLRQLRYDLATVLAREEHSGDDRCDLTLIVDDRKVRVHRLIVCARSTKLQEDLQPVTSQALPGIDLDSLVCVIEYMYTGMLLEKNTEKVSKLQDVAREWVMPELMHACDKFLEEAYPNMALAHLNPVPIED